MHFEFAQERLTEPHRLSTFELAQGAIKVQLQAQLHDVPGFGMTSELLTRAKACPREFAKAQAARLLRVASSTGSTPQLWATEVPRGVNWPKCNSEMQQRRTNEKGKTGRKRTCRTFDILGATTDYGGPSRVYPTASRLKMLKACLLTARR